MRKRSRLIFAVAALAVTSVVAAVFVAGGQKSEVVVSLSFEERLAKPQWYLHEGDGFALMQDTAHRPERQQEVIREAVKRLQNTTDQTERDEILSVLKAITFQVAREKQGK